MKKRILAILLAATMLLSENSVVFAAEETFYAPAQANVLDEMENPEAVSADAAETDEFPEEDFTESQVSDENVSENQFGYEENALREEAILETGSETVSNNIDTIDGANTISANDTFTENVQAKNFAEPRATDEKIVLAYEIRTPGEVTITYWQDINDYTYHPDDQKFICTNGMVPAEVNGLPVTKISGACFQRCPLTQITIPDSVRILEGYNFMYCENLTSITFPKGISEIDTCMFEGCTSLTQITLPDSICKIGNYAFSQCTKLSNITIPKGVTEIAPGTFMNCSSLTQVTIPDSVHTIRESAFERCTGLQEIKIPGTVKEIMYSAFQYCDNLKAVEIESGVVEIGNNAFDGCSDLETIILPKSVTKLAKNTFDDNPDLVIKGYTGSYAEKYAKENFIAFVPIDPVEQTLFTVTFDKNASKASLAANKRTKKVTKGKTYGALPTPTWSGYYFLGWYTAKSGGSKVTSGTKVALKKNQTLYAHWVKADLTAAKIKVNNCTWNGKTQKPKVTITLQGATLKSGSDYTLSYSNNKNPGKGKVVVKGKGVFSRSKTKTAYFTISKAAQTITAKNISYKASYKGKTIALKTSVKGGAKLTYASNKNNQIRVLNKNSSKLKLISPGAATITIKAAETKYYKAATKKVTVALQGTQSISLTSKLLSYNKTTKTYTLTKEISNQSIGVSVKGGAKYACSVANSAQTSAWFGSGDRLTARGRGNITVTIQTEKTKDGVYPALRKSFTIYVNGFQLTNEWSYQQSNNGTLTLMKYLGAASEVTIPNTLILDMQTFAVTALGDGIFENEPVKKVTIQEGSVVTIGRAAFKNCASLSEIRLNSKTKSIGEEAFCGCSSLKSIWLPEGLKTLPASCMKGCSSLEGDVYLPEKLTAIGTSAFENCGQIRNFIIHSYLNSVDNNAFKNCESVQKVYFAGPQTRWNCIRIGSGNDALSKICCNAGGASGAYSASNISTENLFYTYPNYLTNEGYDKITGNLEGEMLDVMASHTASEESAAALKSAMLNGPGYYLKMSMQYLTGSEYITEREVNRALALELLIEEAELSPAEDTALQEIYAVLEPYKKFDDQIFKNGDTRYQLAMKLDGLFAGRQASEINNMLKVIGEKKRWENISAVFKGLDNANKATDFLMTFITLTKIGNDSLDRLSLRLPKDSGLYDGVEQLRLYLNQPLTTLIVDFIANKTVDKCVESFQQKAIVDSLDVAWKHKGYTGSSYVYVATMIYKLIGTMMDCPTIDNYNNAWLSIGNARILRNQIRTVRQELVAAAQKGVCDENLKKDYDLLMRMYLFCLKKTGGYVASTMSDPAKLNARMTRYQDTLEYSSYLAACKSQI